MKTKSYAPLVLPQANMQRLQPISGLLASLLVKYPNLQALAQRAFITYLRSIHHQRDKEVFDVSKLPFEEFAASLGLPMTPVIRFLKQQKGRTATQEKASPSNLPKASPEENQDVLVAVPGRAQEVDESEDESEDEILLQKEVPKAGGGEDLPPGYAKFFFHALCLFFAVLLVFLCVALTWFSFLLVV